MVAVAGIFCSPLLIGAAVHFTSSPLSSVRSPTARDTTSCLDTLRATDSVNAVVKITVKPQDPKTKLPPDFEGLFAQEFRSRLKVPSTLALSVMEGWEACDTVAQTCGAGALMVGSQAYATAHNDGTLSRIGVVDVTLTPAFADSVHAILAKISELKLVPFFQKVDSIPLDISIAVEQNPDSVPAPRHLFRARIPRFGRQFTLVANPKNSSQPKYPSIAVLESVGDTVKVAFTVLPDGTIDPQSVDVVSGHYREFIRSVFDKLATTRYTPAKIGSCAVAMRAEQTFIFRTR